MKLEILDSTLRDGAQGEGVSFSVADKLLIARTLDAFGLDYVEAGNPGSNPKDITFFETMRQHPMQHARLCAFGSTRRKHGSAAEDANVLSLLHSGADTIVIFGKSWDLHAEKVLGVSLQENLDMVSDTVAFIKAHGKELVFDAEHWFDGWRHNPEYAMMVLQVAHDAGADVLCLCDTNGGSLPGFIADGVRAVKQQFPSARVGVHCHNDIGCAVASTIAAVEAGAVHVQGTFTGIGERCGNADLSVLLPILQTKMGYRCVPGGLRELTDTAAKVMDIANMRISANKPFTGSSAFAHKAGMHIDGVQKISHSFEHMPPEEVGNRRRFLMSEVSGRTTVVNKLNTIAPGFTKDSPETAAIVQKLKDLELQGFQFEAADASFALMMLDTLGKLRPHFQLGMYRTSGEFPPPEGDTSASAMLSVQVNGVRETTAAMGNGPVHALDTALRKALAVFYPQLNRVRLSDYKVRVLTGEEATASRVRVLITSTNGEHTWTTVGVSSDIIEASWQALSDSIEFILHKEEELLSWV